LVTPNQYLWRDGNVVLFDKLWRQIGGAVGHYSDLGHVSSGVKM
jgi:hypothetical protein